MSRIKDIYRSFPVMCYTAMFFMSALIFSIICIAIGNNPFHVAFVIFEVCVSVVCAVIFASALYFYTNMVIIELRKLKKLKECKE